MPIGAPVFDGAGRLPTVRVCRPNSKRRPRSQRRREAVPGQHEIGSDVTISSSVLPVIGAAHEHLGDRAGAIMGTHGLEDIRRTPYSWRTDTSKVPAVKSVPQRRACTRLGGGRYPPLRPLDVTHGVGVSGDGIERDLQVLQDCTVSLVTDRRGHSRGSGRW